jgi:hypothetical protein
MRSGVRSATVTRIAGAGVEGHGAGVAGSRIDGAVSASVDGTGIGRGPGARIVAASHIGALCVARIENVGDAGVGACRVDDIREGRVTAAVIPVVPTRTEARATCE